MRHAVDNLDPIFGRVMPERRQSVTLDAAVNEKRAAFAQVPKIDILPLRVACRHLRRYRRDIIDRFAAGELRDTNQ